MKAILLLAVFFTCAFALRTEKQYQNLFVQWMQQHGKSYNHEEFQHRYAIFKTNQAYVDRFNAENESMKLAMNHMGDLTNAEFRKIYLGVKVPANTQLGGEAFVPEESQALPASYDWRQKGAVSGVKDQGQCGSCWSFSTTGSTEGCHQISTKNLVSLSEQNLVDCSGSYGNMGCEGGLMTQAMQYIIANGGIDTESSYPYTAEDGTCQYSASNSGATLKNFKNVKQGDEGDLQKSVYQGPTSVAIDASQSSFQFYSSGVYNEPACSTSQLDHGVLAVGWGNDPSGGDYWIVKNSWGTGWGQNGYIWMSRNKSNQCGIATMATLPTC
jgi:cathepsin L